MAFTYMTKFRKLKSGTGEEIHFTHPDPLPTCKTETKISQNGTLPPVLYSDIFCCSVSHVIKILIDIIY